MIKLDLRCSSFLWEIGKTTSGVFAGQCLARMYPWKHGRRMMVHVQARGASGGRVGAGLQRDNCPGVWSRPRVDIL